VADKQIKFTLSQDAIAYLRWYAKNVLLEDTHHDAARHLLMKQLEEMRRTHRKDDPTSAELNEGVVAPKGEG
jgi:hypothetical protein